MTPQSDFDAELTELPENAQAAKQHGVKSIPTQIFFSADGKELWRHVGFISQSNILAKWAELGYSLPVESPRLADKMALTPAQISKACKIGECAPK
jgi:hypothetical protein